MYCEELYLYAYFCVQFYMKVYAHVKFTILDHDLLLEVLSNLVFKITYFSGSSLALLPTPLQLLF